MAISSTWATMLPRVKFKHLMLRSTVHQHLLHQIQGILNFWAKLSMSSWQATWQVPHTFLVVWTGWQMIQVWSGGNLYSMGLLMGSHDWLQAYKPVIITEQGQCFHYLKTWSAYIHGMLSHMQEDHGIENGMVTPWMEAFRGILHGSYIWGQWVAYLLLICRWLTRLLNQECSQHPHWMAVPQSDKWLQCEVEAVFFKALSFTRAWIVTLMLTSGSSITYSSMSSTRMPLNMPKPGIITPSPYVVNAVEIWGLW